jgi:MFS family permease
VVYCCGGLGILLGGWGCDRMVRRRISGRLEVGMVALAVGSPCVFMALEQPPGAFLAFAAWLLPGCLLFYVYYAAVYAAIQDIVEPARRGTAMALYFFAMYFLGAAWGSTATGWLSDHFAQRTAAARGVAQVAEPDRAIGLHDAMYIIPILGLALVVVLFAASRTVTRDYRDLQRWVAETSPAKPRDDGSG